MATRFTKKGEQEKMPFYALFEFLFRNISRKVLGFQNTPLIKPWRKFHLNTKEYFRQTANEIPHLHLSPCSQRPEEGGEYGITNLEC
jgi:hypothetical protein